MNQLFPIGTHIRSKFTPRLTGLIVGYSVIQGIPHITQTNHTVYLIALDDPMPWDDTTACKCSIVVLNAEHVTRSGI